MFVLSRLFVQSLNIPRQEELEGTKLLKDGNKSLCLEASSVTSLSMCFFASQFLMGAHSLLLSHFFWALLTPPRPALLSGRLRALRSVVTTLSPPLSPCLHFHTTEPHSGGVLCTQGVRVAQQSSPAGQAGMGMAEQAIISSSHPQRCAYLLCTLADLSFPFPRAERVPSLSGEDIRGDGSCFPALSVFLSLI